MKLQMNRNQLLLLTATVVIGAAMGAYIISRRKKSKAKKHIKFAKQVDLEQQENEEVKSETVYILYASTTGTAKQFATTLHHHLSKKCDLEIVVLDMASIDPEDFLVNATTVIFICSTWEGGVPPQKSASFFSWVEEQAFDFRVSKDCLSKLNYAVFGLGGALYGNNYARAAYQLDEWLERLGGNRLEPFAKGDDQTNLEQVFYKWNSRVVRKILESNDITLVQKKARPEQQPNDKYKRFTASAATAVISNNKDHHHRNHDDKKATGTNDACCSTQPAAKPKSKAVAQEYEEDDGETDELDEEDLLNDAFVDVDDDDEDDGNNGDRDITDMEEMGAALTSASKNNKQPADAREMVTRLQNKALTKEGYRIIGSHSAVKICRWTKHQLRGRGGCYKHTFYGITSYQCMEATPSLACANKCVFCWRHHKNPVGTEWRWKEDEPTFIVDEAVRLHVGMINELKGMPGVVPARLQEAYTVKHCALSLVGEPIMYPRINELVRQLHGRGISSFLVTNAQFPDRIEQLEPVTQLYVSVDATNKDTLKAVDRPLFKDFWERFIGSLRALRDKQQRTVYRLTLVKSYNMDEVDGYVNLIADGQPDFIEIKAVTFCGKSDASSLTMQNVPWHEEVCNFGEEICRRLSALQGGVKYGMATEHKHSCCILIAREDKFLRADGWYTWIDYEAFQRLVQAYYDSNGRDTFGSVDYIAKTPSWALYHSEERGFDPVDKRWYRNKSASQATSEVPSVIGDA